ncbi:MAG TPA: di-trans,poly-cis-decaprenylcistransferase [Methanoculleus sp.]|nr:di-trans,poly-cis-decaprenylcistransferase [Methanoculleus sp.]
MIHWLYEYHLRRTLQVFPRHICLMIADHDLAVSPEKIVDVVSWCRELGIEGVTVHISTSGSASLASFMPAIRKIATSAQLHLHCDSETEISGTGMPVVVAIGKSGREEICACIRALAKEGVAPEDVDEQCIEAHLTFKCEPDLVIKTGGSHLTDFLIWQSVYSELFFSDINWKLFRKTDFLRALRDYQFRMRRFGT